MPNRAFLWQREALSNTGNRSSPSPYGGGGALILLSKKAVVGAPAPVTINTLCYKNALFPRKVLRTTGVVCKIFTFPYSNWLPSRQSVNYLLIPISDLFSMNPVLKERGASQAYDPWESVRNKYLCIVSRCRTLEE